MTRPSRGSSDSTSVSNDRRRMPSTETSSASDDAAQHDDAACGAGRCGTETYDGSDAADATRIEHAQLCYIPAAQPMNILLLRPVPGNERFGLGPFFRIEPLGMEYIAAALEARGHRVTLADLRFSASLEHTSRVAASRPGRHRRHARARNRRRAGAGARACARSRRTCRSSSAGTRPRRIPEPFLSPDVDRRRARRRRARAAASLRRARARAAADDGARPGAARSATASVVRTHGDTGDARARRGAAAGAPSRRAAGGVSTRAWRTGRRGWSRRRAAVRSAARSARSGSCTRAPCASGRSTRSARTSRRSATTSSSPTICSGTTRRAASSWRTSCGAAASASTGFSCRAASISSPATPSCSRRGGRSRSDFDIFFGLEAATNEGLDGLTQGRHRRPDRRRASRSRARLGYGVTGNFVIDPAWGERGLRAPVGVRRAPPAVSGRVHDPHAAAGHGVLRRDAARRCGRGAGRTSTCTTCSGSRRSAPSGSSSCTARPGAARC